MGQQLQREDLYNKLKMLMIVRVVLVTVLLGSSALLQIGYGKNIKVPSLLYSLIFITYLLNAIYAFLLPRINNLRAFAFLQIIGDLFFETSLIYITGGAESGFSFTYILSIISASMLLYRRGSYTTAAMSSILYGSLIDLQYYHVIPSFTTGILTPKETFYNVFLNIVAFFLVSFLSSTLSEKLKKKDSDLFELQTFNECVAQSMSSGLVTTDLNGRITSFNRAAEEITGYTFQEVIGRLWYNVFDLKELRDFFEEIGRRKTPYRFDAEVLRKDSIKVVLGMTVSPLKNEKKETTGVIGIFQDITRIKELEDEMKKKDRLAMVGEMAAGMAHEVRNPLASLIGSMQLLREELKLNEENSHLLDIALRETDRLNLIITNFLTYTRPVPLNKRQCDIKELITDAITFLKKSKEYREDINIITEFTEGELTANVDSHQINQVLWNLSINALQAVNGNGEIKVSAKKLKKSLQPGEHLEEYVEIAFIDNGTGIAPEIRDKIFYPFFTTKESGSGLGLAIVQRVIEDHQGTIKVESKVGKGTRFTIYLPVG